jgi:hypothetical protein
MNLMRKCVQIKDELGQLYTYLFKTTIRLPDLLVKFYSMILSHQVAKHTESTIPRVSLAHFVMLTLISLMKTQKSKWIYFAYFYSIM